MIDYSKFPESKRFYSGTERKIGIMVKGDPCIIKFKKNSAEGYRFNHVSEYLGSRIFSLLNVAAQDVHLGIWQDQEVVCVRDFLDDGEIFVPFNGVGDSTLDDNKELYRYAYDDIIRMLHDNIKLTNVQETVNNFWNMFIIDAFLGNFDRHGSNWGFIKKNDRYRLSPVFDNGSCLFPSLNTDDKIDHVMNSQVELQARVFTFPTSQIKLNENKSSYYDIINSMQFEECNQALMRITPRVNWKDINTLIEDTPFISEKRKDFYKKMLEIRYEKILVYAYKQLH